MPRSINKEFLSSYRIYYEDTDSGGVVYYANYLKFFERARTDFLREKSILQSQLEKEQAIIFMVRKCQIEYKTPARLDDLVVIKTHIKELRVASMTMKQEMTRKADGQLLNIMDVEIICVDSKSSKPKRIAQQIKIKLES